MPTDAQTYLEIVAPEWTGYRIDRWLASLPYISSRTRAVQLIERGFVKINERSLKPSFKVQSGMRIHILIPQLTDEASLKPWDAPLDILFEDEDLIVIHKPSGLVVHPAAGHAQDTLVNILIHHTTQLSMGFKENRPGIVHRLDRDTSGILVVAKNDLAHHELSKQFRNKTAHRIYWAIVHGRPRPPMGTIRSLLARDPRNRKRFCSAPKGKEAITHFRVLKHSPASSWIECRLETGRTHQIRVHLTEKGHPILGDPIYGGKFKKSASRLLLHACELGFEHPRTRKSLFFKRDWPDDIHSVIQGLGFEL